MKKRLVAIIMTMAMAATFAGCGSNQDTSTAETPVASTEDNTQAAEKTEDGDYTTLTVSYRTFGSAPTEENIQLVEDELNKITREKIGCEVELLIINSGSYVNQMNLMLTGGEKLDVMGAPKVLIPSAYDSEQLMMLSDLLDEYGDGIKEVLGDDLLRCGQYNNELYSLPIKCDNAVGQGTYVLRKDICEKYGIDVESIDSYEKLTEAFQVVHDNEPDMTILAPGSAGQSFMIHNYRWDGLGDYLGGLDNYGETLDVVNIFETDSYKEYLSIVRDWYNRGFVSSDVTNSIESGPSLMKAGNLFAYTSANKPGLATQEKNSTGCEVEICQVLPTVTITGNIWQWTIPQQCEVPDKAMQFLNLLYTDADVVNLMFYGVEGVHYVTKEDGRINYPEGIDATTSGFNMSDMVWSAGNEFIAKVWEGNDLDIWEQTAAWNKTGTVSKAYGFVFDSSVVSNERAAVLNVYEQYKLSLECGVVDPETTLKEMNDKLYEAGLQVIIDEKQAQLDKWSEANGIK